MPMDKDNSQSHSVPVALSSRIINIAWPTGQNAPRWTQFPGHPSPRAASVVAWDPGNTRWTGMWDGPDVWPQERLNAGKWRVCV